MKTFAFVAGTLVLASAGVALAQPQAMQHMDRNADVTRQQVIERADQRFARLDVNNDGRATREEAQQAREQHREQAGDRMFERFDLNRDGNVTRAEFDQAREQRAERGGERGPRAGMRGHRRGGPGMHGGEAMFGEQGFITREQMRERALARFDRLDANRDGTLTAAEREQGREQMRERFRERRQQRSGQEG